MRLYLLPGCPFAHRATIVLQEKKLTFEPVFFSLQKHPTELEAISPFAKSPTLVDGETRAWDSQIVIEYLEDRYPEPALMPTEPAARADVRMLAARVDRELGPKTGAIMVEVLHKAPANRDEAKIEAAQQGFVTALAWWDARLAGREFLVGDALSLADVTLFTLLHAYRGLTRTEIATERTQLRGWYERMAARGTTKLLERSSADGLSRGGP